MCYTCLHLQQKIIKSLANAYSPMGCGDVLSVHIKYIIRLAGAFFHDMFINKVIWTPEKLMNIDLFMLA